MKRFVCKFCGTPSSFFEDAGGLWKCECCGVAYREETLRRLPREAGIEVPDPRTLMPEGKFPASVSESESMAKGRKGRKHSEPETADPVPAPISQAEGSACSGKGGAQVFGQIKSAICGAFRDRVGKPDLRGFVKDYPMGQPHRVQATSVFLYRISACRESSEPFPAYRYDDTILQTRLVSSVLGKIFGLAQADVPGMVVNVSGKHACLSLCLDSADTMRSLFRNLLTPEDTEEALSNSEVAEGIYSVILMLAYMDLCLHPGEHIYTFRESVRSADPSGGRVRFALWKNGEQTETKEQES